MNHRYAPERRALRDYVRRQVWLALIRSLGLLPPSPRTRRKRRA